MELRLLSYPSELGTRFFGVSLRALLVDGSSTDYGRQYVSKQTGECRTMWYHSLADFNASNSPRDCIVVGKLDWKICGVDIDSSGMLQK